MHEDLDAWDRNIRVAVVKEGTAMEAHGSGTVRAREGTVLGLSPSLLGLRWVSNYHHRERLAVSSVVVLVRQVEQGGALLCLKIDKGIAFVYKEM